MTPLGKTLYYVIGATTIALLAWNVFASNYSRESIGTLLTVSVLTCVATYNLLRAARISRRK